MIRQSLFISVALVLLALCTAAPGAAILNCVDCGCSFACSTRCFTDTGSSTCGAQTSLCVGSPSCGGGCLMVPNPKTFLESLRTDPQQASSQPQGQVLARLTWRLAQHAEENGLGAVYSGNTGFLLSKATGRLKVPALAFVSREHLKAGSPWSGAPDVAVELRASAARDWLNAGTRAVLVVDAGSRTVSLYQKGAEARVLSADDVLELPEVLPGWSLRVGELFQ
ncbi:MAG TPA: Uma2 family endonuclease [Thermoanaerobaculia bacterium]|nr:Uma2 family endonuclease [Thermoanaerobaculia bacterium]